MLPDSRLNRVFRPKFSRVPQIVDLLPVFMRTSTAFLEDLVDLVLIVFAWKERFAREEFVHEATYRPDIDVKPILSISEQKFRRSVPKSDHSVCHTWMHACSLSLKLPGKSEISQFYASFVVHEDVRTFNVSVKNVVVVKVFQT